MKDKIELLSETLISQHKDLALEILGMSTKLSIGLGWHYILDIIWILNNLDLNLGSVVLDAGGGTGILQFILAKKGYKVVSVDVNKRGVPDFTRNIFNIETIGTDKEIEHSYLKWHEWSQDTGQNFKNKNVNQNSAPTITFYHADLKNMKKIKNKSIDSIVSLSALEHNDPETIKSILYEFKRILKSRSKMLITVSASNRSFFHKESHSWIMNESDIMEIYNLKENYDSNFHNFDELFKQLCIPKYLNSWLNHIYYKNEKNGMPLGIWNPKYIPVGIIKNIK